MKILGKTVTAILLIILFVGLLVLLYPAVSQYWNSKVQSRAVADYERMLSDTSEEDFALYFSAADKYNKQLTTLDAPLVQYREINGYNEALDLTGNGVMGYVTIDKIRVILPIYHGTSNEVLNVACGHLEGSSLPVGGVSTHCVLSAHRGLPTAALFTNLDKLEIGDVFTLTVLGEVLTYQVDQIKVVTPDVTGDLAITQGEDLCTLLTCTPYAINSHRLLVRGTRIKTVTEKKVYVNAEGYIIDKLIVAPAVALPILLVLILIVIFKPVKKKPRLSDVRRIS